MLRYYALIESRYGGNRFTVVVRERNENFFMTPAVCIENVFDNFWNRMGSGFDF